VRISAAGALKKTPADMWGKSATAAGSIAGSSSIAPFLMMPGRIFANPSPFKGIAAIER